MTESIMSQGLTLMLFGMGAVFVFLALLVAVTSAMSGVVVRFFPEAAEPTPAVKAQPANGASAPPVDATTLQILQAAIDQHRGK